ncbi:RimJ/RimL family protein N-acetyltransferase [Curtobacterium herbarum]|uniref:GNAT family N-acetyltransferase n=1 Tax=Curtobacterium herbarum TaxID=150122 RepID=UPI00209E52EC|nr:GNAT family protein [Curtobacterium herbarum]MCP1503639.1 RimJ/RimL family protein N-acetyltransferase [Curtobacterium herbarum]
MELEKLWPLFGLELRTPRLVLRPVRDQDLPALAQAALDGIHNSDRMPFGFPWTDASPEELPRNLATYQWSLRQVSPQNWTIQFAVILDDEVIGAQDLAAFNFADRRTVNSGSWLTRRAQGKGVGTEMRAALLLFAFDTLGAEWAESSAAAWNTPSLTVSYKLGYEPNGVTQVSPRSGQPVDEQRVRLSRGAFKRPKWNLQTIGDQPVLAQLGITAS